MSIKNLVPVLGFVLVSFLASASAYADEVRKSGSGICHDESSRYFSRLKSYTSYDSMEECINPDARTTKYDDDVPLYNRNYFGRWADEDKNCRNTRAEVLISQSTGQVRFRSDRRCVVASGRWISPFTNDVITSAASIDVDHVYPLALAWKSGGAHTWDYEKRRAFANDPRNLIPVEYYLNRQKGAKGITEWLPPENRCGYIARYLRVAKLYDIAITTEERELADYLCF